MLKLSKGFKVTRNEELNEGYRISSENSFVANVDADKISDVINHFITLHNEEPMFFILELPVNIDRENIIAPGVVQDSHKDVYYIDGCSANECSYLVEQLGELLINDGISQFGFGCHETQDEIMIGKYNCITIYSRNIRKFDGFFERHDINEDSDLKLAWDTFTRETPGRCERYEINGKSVFDIPEMLKDWGIYLAETRED